MKKIDLKMLGITAMVTGCVLAGSTSAFAAEPKFYDSNAVIKFKANEDGTTDPEKPVDPTDPGKEVDPVDPTKPGEKPDPGTKGPLSIDFASSLIFGEQDITSVEKTYTVKPQKFNNRNPEDGPNYVQVTDNRGTHKGWTLTLTQMGQFKTEAGQELKGAAISFDNGHVVTTVEEGALHPIGPEKFTLQIAEDGTGVAQNIMVAGDGKGAGTYLHVYGDNSKAAESITLTVPGKTTKYAANYSTKLKWTLSDVPVGNEGDE
ncbi:WxL domain-containing protein [Lysinibacillus agricola]|uniref:WxL domain-containing protein n=1 Tax=Lysinibacillus agricola TaxID=2590012 RepID=A0ABX7ASK5_9BACI|nr:MULTISPECIES: WxL domain-containing protein [Lysinibacillus]KOS63086.1 cell surface protein [Lysinibacillus sp. FJAT-14222]QQP12930.1 WxL domain-containing protein [Lysinibacillus agricola]